MDDTRGRVTKDGIRIYEDADFAGMRAAGQVAAEILDMVAPLVQPGVTTAANDSGLAIIDELQGLRQELSDLRAEQMTASAAIASGTGKTARILERVTPDGDAIAVRTAA